MSFAADLSEISSQAVPDVQTYVKAVQKICREMAVKGHNIAEGYVFDFFYDLEEFRKKLGGLGLIVTQLRLTNDRALAFKVAWTVKRKSDGDANPTKKRRISSTVVWDNTGTFAAELASTSTNFKPDMQQYIAAVQKKCCEQAGKGHNSAEDYVFDFFCDLEDFRNELDMLGLSVTRLRLHKDKALAFKVTWSSAPQASIFQPCGLTSGNVWGECKVCFSSARMCRLHPCGHLTGACCAKQLMKKPCPFCRNHIRIVHALFEP